MMVHIIINGFLNLTNYGDFTGFLSGLKEATYIKCSDWHTPDRPMEAAPAPWPGSPPPSGKL